ncbi:MAG: beta-galactosidase trimerization domain-containing protein [Bacillota bacterium]|nr:beta-galactosidase trimerization domain-containing protein [Bacillota bacterium]
MKKWYKESKWRNLVDMHINDWNPDFMSKFSSEVYADNMHTAKLDAAELYTGNCLGICYFPTEVGHMHNGLKGKDITGPTLAALKARGLHTIAYFNMWCRWGFDTHPSWRMISADGKNSMQIGFSGQGRYGLCCPNNEGYREYTRAQIKYLCEHYDFDGMWIDMIGWFTMICHCSSCRDRYFNETGREIPRKVDWTDPEWVAYQRRRQAWFVDFTHIVNDTARAIKPDVTMAFQSGSWLSGWFNGTSDEFIDLSDYLAADIYGTALECSVVCKCMNNLTLNKPIEYMTSRCVHLYHHTINKSKEEMRILVYGAIAHNAAFTFIDAINPDGTMDKRLYEMLGSLKEEFVPYFKYWRPDATMLRDVTVYSNMESLFDPHSSQQKGFSVCSSLEPFASALIADHLLYDMAFKKNRIKEICEQSKVVFLNNAYMLHDNEIEVLEAYVKNGGSLIITYLTGMYDPNGGLRNDFALAKLMGVHFESETIEDVTYINPEDHAKELFLNFDHQYPMSVISSAVKVKLDQGVAVLAKLTLPYSHSTENYRFASAISNPPGIETDYPAVTVNRYEKGKVMYIAMPIQADKFDAVKEVTTTLIRHMLPTQTYISTNAPKWLETLLYHDDESNFYQLFLVNSMDAFYSAEVNNVEVVLNLPDKIKSVVNVKTGEFIPFTNKDSNITIKFGLVHDFGMYILQPE